MKTMKLLETRVLTLSSGLWVWGSSQLKKKKGAENEVQLVLLSAPELLASRARQGQQPKNMGSFTLVFVSSSMVKRRYHHQITGW